MNYPQVSILVLNWNGLNDTTECLDSLKNITYPNYKAIVIDNGSDGNEGFILKKKYGEYITILQNDNNYGVSKGFNIGINYARENLHSDYVLIMNNDLVVAPGFLDELVTAAEASEKVGLAGPKIYYYDYNGRKDVLWSAGGKIRPWRIKVFQQMGENEDDGAKYQRLTSVDWISGATLLIKRQVLEKAGLLDPWYFFAAVDIEYCLRVREHRFEIMYVPTAKVWHKVGVSARKANLTYANPSSYYHLLKQHFPWYTYFYHLLIMPVLFLRWTVLYFVKNRNLRALATFFSDFAGFFLRRRKQRQEA